MLPDWVRPALLAGCVACLVWGARAGRGDVPSWTPLAPGVWEQRLQVRAPQTRLPVELHCVRVDLSRTELRVLDARSQGAAALHAREHATSTGAVAAINGSFFREDLTPMGLLVSGGKTINTLRRADWGVFWVGADHEAHIVHTRDWRAAPPEDAEFAIQAGPRLVVGGEVTQVRPSLARRTAICVLPAPREVVLVASSQALLLSEFAELLRRSAGDSGGMGCRFALNLDGGSSTQLYVAHSPNGVGVSAVDQVPIALGVFPRAEPPPKSVSK